MSMQILRATKLKTVGNVSGSLQHMLRENNKAPNADPERTQFNLNSVQTVREGMAKFKALEPEFKQKNNVEAIEFLVTASPQFFQDESKLTWRSYLNDGLEWIKKMIGSKNIVATSIQLDEKTPHLSVIARPLVERRFKGGRVKTALSAKRYLDGSALLSKMQDNFHDEVANEYGLERGIKGSLASHQTLQAWYGEQAGGAARVRELELEAERLRAQIEEERERFYQRLKALDDEITQLQEEGGRWRKEAIKISSNWFSSDIANAKTIDALDGFKTEIAKSHVLPRGAKAALTKMADEKVAALTPKPPSPTKTRTRGGR